MLHARETQTIMQSLACRSSSVRTESPVVDFSFEDRRIAGTAGSLSAGGENVNSLLLDHFEHSLTGRDATVIPERTSSTLKASVSAGVLMSRTENRSMRMLPRGHVAPSSSMVSSRLSGPQA